MAKKSGTAKVGEQHKKAAKSKQDKAKAMQKQAKYEQKAAKEEMKIGKYEQKIKALQQKIKEANKKRSEYLKRAKNMWTPCYERKLLSRFYSFTFFPSSTFKRYMYAQQYVLIDTYGKNKNSIR